MSDERKRERKWRQFWEHTAVPETFLTSTHARTEGVRELIASKAKQLLPDGARVLDVGCGTALAYPYFVEAGFFYRGIDFTENFVFYAEKNRQFRAGEGVEIMDARHMTYPNNSFEIATCKDVLEHLPPKQYQLVLKEMARVARNYLIIGFFRPPRNGATQYHVVTEEENAVTAGCYSNRYSRVELLEFLYKLGAKWVNIMQNENMKKAWVEPKGFSVWTVAL